MRWLEIECRTESCIRVESGPALFGLAKSTAGGPDSITRANISAESGKIFYIEFNVKFVN